MGKKRTMKRVLVCIVMTLAICLWGGRSAYAQTKVVNLDYKDVSFVEVFNEIRKQTGVKAMYNLEKVRDKRCKNLVVRNEPVQKAVAIVCALFGLDYSIVEGVVVIKEDANPPKMEVQGPIKGQVVDVNGDPLPGANVLLKGTKVGTAADIDGYFTIPLGTKPEKEYVLLVSFIGMQTSEVKVRNYNKPLRIVLQVDDNTLDEVVVETGYSRLPRKDMVGAFTTVKADDIMMPAYQSVDQMLQGKIPGMIVSNTSARVGSSPQITIRGTSTILGNTDPLWVVDGIIQSDPLSIDVSSTMTEDMSTLIGNQISWLNPQDIETITVLKDASATAIYGSKASNGVIVITTKKGSAERTSVRYSTNISIRQRSNYDMFNYMNSKERIQFSKEAYDAGARYQSEPLPQIYTYEGLMAMYNKRLISESDLMEQMEFLETCNTDWFKILTRNSVSQSHNLSISGGTQKVTYNASFGYTSSHGTEKGNDQTRLTTRLFVGAQINKRLRLDFNVNGSFGSSNGYGPGVNPESYALNTSRSIPAYDQNGDRVFYKQYYSYQLNKRDIGTLEYEYNILNEMENSYSKNKSTVFNVSVNLDYKITDWLTYQWVGSISQNSNNAEAYAGERSSYIEINYRGYAYGAESSGSEKFNAAMLPFGGQLTTSVMNSTSYDMQNKLILSKTFNEKHRLNAMLAMQVRSVKNKNNGNTVWGYVPERGEILVSPTKPSDLVPIGGTEPSSWGALSSLYEGGWSNTTLTNNYVSIFGTIAYSLMDKYVWNVNMRQDASNRFGQDANHQFNPTYSLGFSWKMAEEPFIKNYVTWLNQLNLRATYGIQGNVVNSVSPELIARYQGLLDGYNEYFLTISSLPNPLLKWESTRTWNFGLDLQLFNGLTMNLEYYGRRSNAIVEQDVAQEYGMGQMKINGGRIYNHGIELMMNLTPFKTKNFAWTIGFNASKNWNKSENPDRIIKANEVSKSDFLSGSSDRPLKKGYPLTAFWSYSFAGLDPETGYPLFNNIEFEGDGDLEVDPTTFLVYSGQSDPYFSGGFNTRIRYKDFSFGADFSALLGAKKRLPDPYANFTNGKLPSPFYSLSKDLTKRWQEPGDEQHTIIPAIYTSIGNDYRLPLPDGQTESRYSMWADSDVMVASASFLRCTQISFTYNLPKRICAKFGATSASFSGNINNLFVIASSRWNGFDPELGSSVHPKIYSFGLNVSF